MRRLLMVAYMFPPIGGIGVERTLRHVAHLPEFGWQPVIAAASNSGYRIVDPASVDRIPAHAEVHRARTVEPAHLRHAVARLLGRSGAASAVRFDPSLANRRPPSGLRSAANAAWAAVIPLVFFPDDQLLWIPGAVAAGRRAAAAGQIDAIYSSSPPVSGHIAAALLARRLGRPWVADFRDPWIGNAFARPLPAPHRALQRRVERWIVDQADRVVLATSRMRDDFAARYPDRALRFVHIPNGYEPSELNVPPAHREDDRFHLVYAGSLYGERELELLLDGVERLLERRPEWRDRVRVDFVGWFSQANLAIAAERLPALAPVVRHHGFRPRPDAIAMQRAADAGLVLIAAGPNREGVATGKLYEYLGLDLPILAVTPPGEVRDILAALDWGVTADPTPDGVAGGLERVIEAQHPDRPADPERRYERRSLTGRLVEILEEVSLPSE